MKDSIILLTMISTEVLIVGASISGLASAASLQKRDIEYIIVEKESQVAAPWRNHYDRLHLHTNKRISNLPYKKFDKKIPRYPSRLQVIEYLEEYQKEFNINPVFNTEVKSIRKGNGNWIAVTNYKTYQSTYVIIATGPFTKPRIVNLRGLKTFAGRIIHSSIYKTGKDFANQKVLVVGFGNSACEIAIDLYEQGAKPSMSVRSSVNIVPRDILGIPILEISLALSHLPARVADIVSDPLNRLLIGDITNLGLKKKPYGPFEEIKRDGHIPVLDIGTVKHIRQQHIHLYDDIDHIQGSTVSFLDGKQQEFDAIIAAIGYYSDYANIIDIDKSRIDDLKLPVNKQKYFGKDGLYFCGFWIAPTGQIREIALDAQKIAKDITRKKQH